MGRFNKLGFSFDVEEINNELNNEDLNEEKKAECIKRLSKHDIRKFTSEQALLDAVPEWKLQKGYSYHFMTWGDIDSLSYLLFISKQQVIKECVLSTWAMNHSDIEQIEALLKKGIIKHIDFYVGEIFKNRYSKEYDILKRLNQEYGCNVVLFRNHSKIIAIRGEEYDCVVESSANVNRNPRCENTCITLDTELTTWYFNFFRDIKSFEKVGDDDG